MRGGGLPQGDERALAAGSDRRVEAACAASDVIIFLMELGALRIQSGVLRIHLGVLRIQLGALRIQLGKLLLYQL